MRFISARRSSDNVVTRFCGLGSISGRAGPRLLSSYVLRFTLLDNRCYQSERWGVMRCNERLEALLDPFNIFEATGWY
jgi:hypothetical protein